MSLASFVNILTGGMRLGSYVYILDPMSGIETLVSSIRKSNVFIGVLLTSIEIPDHFWGFKGPLEIVSNV